MCLLQAIAIMPLPLPVLLPLPVILLLMATPLPEPVKFNAEASLALCSFAISKELMVEVEVINAGYRQLNELKFESLLLIK